MKHLISWLRLRELRRTVGKKKFSLLDLGCGDGGFVSLARKKGVDAVGVDKKHPPCPSIIQSTIKDLKLDKKFDVVTLYHVLEHLKNPKQALTKASSFLKKDGLLAIEVPLVGNFTERFLEKDYFAYHDKSHLHFFSKKEILELLTKAGLRIKKKGLTLLEFPLTALTTSFKKGFSHAIKGMILFLPLKTLSIFGLNDEIIRLYCLKK